MMLTCGARGIIYRAMGISRHSLEKAGMAAVDGGQVAYRYYVPHDPAAAKRTPLLMIHGGPGASHIGMHDALAELADERPVIYYDQLGSYLSPAKMTDELMSFERFAREPGQVLDALGIDKAILFGYSWGGAIAAAFALDHPERVEGMVLASPLISTQRWTEDCNNLLKKLPEDVQDTINRYERSGNIDHDDYRAAEQVFCRHHYNRAANPPLSVARNAERQNNDVAAKMWGASEFRHRGTLGDLDLFYRLQEIDAPTFIITGEHDVATPAYMKEIAAGMKDAALFVVPGASHAAFVEENRVYLNAVGDFLRKRFDAVPVPKHSPAKPLVP